MFDKMHKPISFTKKKIGNGDAQDVHSNKFAIYGIAPPIM